MCYGGLAAAVVQPLAREWHCSSPLSAPSFLLHGNVGVGQMAAGAESQVQYRSKERVPSLALGFLTVELFLLQVAFSWSSQKKKKKIAIAWLVLMPAIFHFLWELCRSSFVLLVLEWTAMFMFLDLQGKSVLKVSAQSAGGKLFLHAICASRVSQAVPNLKCYVENCTGLDNFEAA